MFRGDNISGQMEAINPIIAVLKNASAEKVGERALSFNELNKVLVFCFFSR